MEAGQPCSQMSSSLLPSPSPSPSPDFFQLPTPSTACFASGSFCLLSLSGSLPDILANLSDSPLSPKLAADPASPAASQALKQQPLDPGGATPVFCFACSRQHLGSIWLCLSSPWPGWQEGRGYLGPPAAEVSLLWVGSGGMAGVGEDNARLQIQNNSYGHIHQGCPVPYLPLSVLTIGLEQL